MSQATSPSCDRRYGLQRVCRAWEIARSTVYAIRSRRTKPRPMGRRGPKPRYSDEKVLEAIRQALEKSPFVGDGYRKVWARLRLEGVRVGRPRVLRLMRENGLLAPGRCPRPRGPQVHDGSIIPDRPNMMWGIDATSCWTRLEGQATIFVAVDHASFDCVGIHAARKGTRFEALEPLRQGVRDHFGQYGQNAAAGLTLRHDHGSQFMSDLFQTELIFLGIESSPAFVRQPEGNGSVERFIRILKEQLLWIQLFDTVEELLSALHRFVELYNREWMLERHGYLSPSAARQHLALQEAA